MHPSLNLDGRDSPPQLDGRESPPSDMYPATPSTYSAFATPSPAGIQRLMGRQGSNPFIAAPQPISNTGPTPLVIFDVASNPNVPGIVAPRARLPSTPSQPRMGPRRLIDSGPDPLVIFANTHNPNTSGTVILHPSSLVEPVPGSDRYYPVTAGWEIGVFNVWAIAEGRLTGCIGSTSVRMMLTFTLAVHYYAICYHANQVHIRPRINAPPVIIRNPSTPVRNHQQRSFLSAPAPFTPGSGTASHPYTIASSPATGTPSHPFVLPPSPVLTRQTNARPRAGPGPSNRNVVEIITDSESESDSEPLASTSRIVVIDDDSDDEDYVYTTPARPRLRRPPTVQQTQHLVNPVVSTNPSTPVNRSLRTSSLIAERGNQSDYDDSDFEDPDFLIHLENALRGV